MNKLIGIALLVFTVSLSSCGSFGEGFLNAIGSYGGGYGMGAYPQASGNNLNYLLDPNYAIQQVNAQNESEYQQAKQFNPSLTREQFMQNKANVYQATKQAISGGSGISNSSSTRSSSASCPQCHGLGKCWTCNGNRKYINPLTNKYVACPNCTNGLCSSCGGTGKR